MALGFAKCNISLPVTRDIITQTAHLAMQAAVNLYIIIGKGSNHSTS